MSATTLRSDIRQEVRDNIQEVSGIGGAIFSDPLINRHITREIRSLPKNNIYLEELWQTSLNSSTDYSNGLALPDGTEKVEEVEINSGNSTSPSWIPFQGVDFYQGSLFFPSQIFTSQDIRVKIKKQFTIPTGDLVALDVPDDKCEILVWGVTLRLYRIMIGYLRGSQSWDTVTKPGDVSINSVSAWIRSAEQHYKELIQQYQTEPKPRDIDLVS